MELGKVRRLLAPGLLGRVVTTAAGAAAAAVPEQGVGLRHFEHLEIKDDVPPEVDVRNDGNRAVKVDGGDSLAKEE